MNEELRRRFLEYAEDSYDWGRLEETYSRKTGLSWAEYRDQMLDEMVEMVQEEVTHLCVAIQQRVLREAFQKRYAEPGNSQFITRKLLERMARDDGGPLPPHAEKHL